jgi:hypothetical protein
LHSRSYRSHDQANILYENIPAAIAAMSPPENAGPFLWLSEAIKFSIILKSSDFGIEVTQLQIVISWSSRAVLSKVLYNAVGQANVVRGC